MCYVLRHPSPNHPGLSVTGGLSRDVAVRAPSGERLQLQARLGEGLCEHPGLSTGSAVRPRRGGTQPGAQEVSGRQDLSLADVPVETCPELPRWTVPSCTQRQEPFRAPSGAGHAVAASSLEILG